MKKLFWLCACLLALLVNPVTCSAQSPDIVVVRIADAGGKVRCAITGAKGRSEVVEFDSGASEKSLTAAGQGYYNVFDKLYQEGYSLQSTFTGQGIIGSNVYTSLITLLFVKNPKP